MFRPLLLYEIVPTLYIYGGQGAGNLQSADRTLGLLPSPHQFAVDRTATPACHKQRFDLVW